MKPDFERIFLQNEAGPPEAGDIERTWCQDRVYEHDTEYIRLDLHQAEVATLSAAIALPALIERCERAERDKLAYGLILKQLSDFIDASGLELSEANGYLEKAKAEFAQHDAALARESALREALEVSYQLHGRTPDEETEAARQRIKQTLADTAAAAETRDDRLRAEGRRAGLEEAAKRLWASATRYAERMEHPEQEDYSLEYLEGRRDTARLFACAFREDSRVLAERGEGGGE